MCAFSCARVSRFFSCDLDFESMTLRYELDPDILKIYLRAENELSRSRLSKVEYKRDRTHKQINTDRRDRTHYHNHIHGW